MRAPSRPGRPARFTGPEHPTHGRDPQHSTLATTHCAPDFPAAERLPRRGAECPFLPAPIDRLPGFPAGADPRLAARHFGRSAAAAGAHALCAPARVRHARRRGHRTRRAHALRQCLARSILSTYTGLSRTAEPPEAPPSCRLQPSRRRRARPRCVWASVPLSGRRRRHPPTLQPASCACPRNSERVRATLRLARPNLSPPKEAGSAFLFMIG